jgi:hypothetical protein
MKSYLFQEIIAWACATRRWNLLSRFMRRKLLIYVWQLPK